jgi:beta-lactamase regulating signal transducer with metallopeptidase domain
MSKVWLNTLTTGSMAWIIAVDLVVRTTILLALVLVAHVLLGHRRVLFRSGLWNAALVALLMLPAFTLALPRLRVAWLPTLEFSAARVQASSEDGTVAVSADRMIAAVDPLPPRSSSTAVSRELETVTSPVSSKRVVHHVANSFWTLLVHAYMAGVLVLTLRLLASVWAVGQLKRTALEVEDSFWTEPLGRWRHRLRINRPVDLVQSGRVRVPLVVGWLRPAIVLPVSDHDCERATETEVDATLIHELAHLHRGDDLWCLVQQIVQVVYWPHPLIWLAARLIAGAREQACDDLCVQWVGSARNYREVLLAVASRLVKHSGSLSVSTSIGLAMAQGSSTALSGRLGWIDRTRGSSSCILRWPGRLGIAMIVLGLSSLLGMVELGRARASQPIPLSDNSAPERAYELSVPESAKFQTVTLTVLDDETSKPLAGVEVEILNYVDLQDKHFLTDNAGRLRFEYPSIGKPSLNIELRKNGYVPLRRYWGDSEDSMPVVDDLTMKLRRGTTMGGIVVYAQDQPVEGVTVVMTVNKYGPDQRPQNPTGHEIYYEVPSRTGPDGRWRTDSVPPGAELVHLQLIHPDFVSDGSTTRGARPRLPKVAALRNQTDRQVLTKGVKISGRVLDDKGTPIAGARVVESTQGLTFLRYVRNAITDAEGRFYFHVGRGGPVSLTVQVKGYEPKTRVVLPDPDTPPVEFRLPPGKKLRARVVDPKGKPIAAACVIIPSHRGVHKGIFFREWTDAQGHFEWESAPAEPVGYAIGADGYVWVEPIALTAGEKEEVVVLKPALDIRLRVIDAETGKPIETFGIQTGTANPDSPGFRWAPPTSGEFHGEYRTSLEAEKGPYQIRVIANGYTQAQTRVFSGEERKVTETIALVRQPQPPRKNADLP